MKTVCDVWCRVGLSSSTYSLAMQNGPTLQRGLSAIAELLVFTECLISQIAQRPSIASRDVKPSQSIHRVKVYQTLDPGSSRKNLQILHRIKSRNLALIFDPSFSRPCFETEQHIWILIWAGEAQMINLRIAPIWCSLFHSPLRKLGYKIPVPQKRPEK